MVCLPVCGMAMNTKLNFFWVNFVTCLVTAAIILLMVKWLNKIVKEHGA